MSMLVEIISCGSGLSLQDTGRVGWMRYGVPSSGAMDQSSLQLANRLLGNPLEAPCLEMVLLGARIRVLQDCWLAVAGAGFCQNIAAGCAQPIEAGTILEFDQKAAGLYAYLAVPGGFSVAPYLGSVSSDLRNGLGMALKKGTRLSSARSEANISTESVARRIATERPKHLQDHSQSFELYPGPQFESFSAQARQQLVENTWTVSPRSDRTGYRLEGPALEVPASIASEPVLPGSFQIPGNGRPIVTMADGPTVGGYAKLAVLKSDDLDRFAQCAPGSELSFSWID